MNPRKKKCVLFLDHSGKHGPAVMGHFNSVASRLGLAFEGSLASTEQPPATTIAINGEAPDVAERWTIADAADIEREVSGLIARLLGGSVVADVPKPAKPLPEKPKKVHTVRVGRETAGRHGKGVTTVFDLPLTLDGVKELAATLKQKCGTGGTVKEGKIEIQGEHRDKITAELEKLGYKVKRTGG